MTSKLFVSLRLEADLKGGPLSELESISTQNIQVRLKDFILSLQKLNPTLSSHLETLLRGQSLETQVSLKLEARLLPLPLSMDELIKLSLPTTPPLSSDSGTSDP